MNFSQTISILFIGGAIATNIQPALSNTTVKIARVLAPEQINLRAKQITVRIDGGSVGSGAIIAESNNVYTVLTNWHVMQNPGQYTIQTIDGRQHQVNSASIKQIGTLDLAIAKFDSNQNYQVAETGDSRNLVEGQDVYFAGYPGELRREDSRYYRFFAANLVGILPNTTANGYSLIYNGEAFPGMSGGPVFNRNGNLIGIHGEANINAITGGTSNYAIPIDVYQEAIAKNEPTPTASTETNSEVPEVPEVIIETQPSDDDSASGSASNSNETNNTPSVAESTPEPTGDRSDNAPSTNETQSNTSTTDAPPQTNSTQEEPAAEDSTISSIPTFSSEDFEDDVREVQNNSTASPSSTNAVENNNSDSTNDEVSLSDWRSPPSLVSTKTGIDYKPLRSLLEAKQWQEADRQTYQLIERIIESAKQQNQNIFIELKTIADFSCSDVRTIDSLWQKYSDKQFGFTPQQKIWQNINQNEDFSTATWRRFATRVGWKQGEVASAGGYLLYDQLNFNPDRAPEGHLPWWFALPDEEQNVLKYLFARCNLDPAAAAAEARAEAEAKKAAEAEANSPDEENNAEDSNSQTENQKKPDN